MSLAKAGDQVILPRPHYFNHDMWMRMQGIEPVALDQSHYEYRLSADHANHRYSEIYRVEKLEAIRPGFQLQRLCANKNEATVFAG